MGLAGRGQKSVDHDTRAIEPEAILTTRPTLATQEGSKAASRKLGTETPSTSMLSQAGIRSTFPGRYKIDVGDERHRPGRLQPYDPDPANFQQSAQFGRRSSEQFARRLQPHRCSHRQPDERPHRSVATRDQTFRNPMDHATKRPIPRRRCRFRATAPCRPQRVAPELRCQSLLGKHGSYCRGRVTTKRAPRMLPSEFAAIPGDQGPAVCFHDLLGDTEPQS